MVKVWAQVGPKAIFGDCLERIQNSGRLQRPGPPGPLPPGEALIGVDQEG